MEDNIYRGCKIEQEKIAKWVFYKRSGESWVKCPFDFGSEKQCKEDIDWFLDNKRD